MSPLPPAGGEPQVRFSIREEAPAGIDLEGLAPVFASPARTATGENASALFRLPGLDVLRFAGEADFYLGPGSIQAHVRAPGDGGMLEIRLLGPVLSFWLERAGILALHASAVALNGRAIGFLGGNGAGKSALVAALMEAGGRLLTDDLLALELAVTGFLARPGYPQMRMWPDLAASTGAAQAAGTAEDLPRVHPEIDKRRVVVGSGYGAFEAAPHPLAGFYLLERRAERGEPRIEPLSAADAVIEIVRHSFSPRLMEAAGLQPDRLDRIARLVREVPVRRLVYSAGFEHLPRVTREIVADLAGSDIQPAPLLTLS